MRYRTKLFLAFALMVIASTFTALAVVYKGTNELVFNQIRSQVFSIAVTASTELSGDLIEKCVSSGSPNTPEYNTLVQKLQSLLDLPFRSEVLIEHIYVIHETAPKKYIFIGGAKDFTKNPPIFGQVVSVAPEDLEDIGKFPLVSKKPYTDSWGTWLTAYIPIYNSQKRVTGILAMDVSITYIKSELNHLLMYGLLALIGALLIALIVAYILSKIVTSSLQAIYNGVTALRLGDLTTHITLNTNDEFNDLAIALNAMTKSLQEKERLTSAFGRYVSHHVLDTILHSNKPSPLEGVRKKVTVLFCDIHQFTLISETLPPEIVVSLLNEYLTQMISIIFNHQGTLDKFIGDGIMAEFGVPLDDPLQEVHAIQTAIDMQNLVTTLSKKWKKEYKFDMTIGIGIHTGFAIIGNIGSSIRMEYTAIGDTVNVASRLESSTKSLGVPILISEETYKNSEVPRKFQCQDLGLIQLSGREKPIRAYAVLFTTKTKEDPL